MRAYAKWEMDFISDRGKLEIWATEEFRAWKKNRRQWVKNEKSRAATAKNREKRWEQSAETQRQKHAEE